MLCGSTPLLYCMGHPWPDTRCCVSQAGRTMTMKIPTPSKTRVQCPGSLCISFSTWRCSLAHPQLASLAGAVEFTENVICSRNISMHHARIQQCSLKIMLSSKINQLKGILHSIKNVNRVDSWLFTMHLYEYVVTGQIQNTHVLQKINQMHLKMIYVEIAVLYKYSAIALQEPIRK